MVLLVSRETMEHQYLKRHCGLSKIVKNVFLRNGWKEPELGCASGDSLYLNI